MGNDMSWAQGYLCVNTPNQFRIGWNRAIANLFPNNTNTQSNTGLPQRWRIVATSLTEQNYVVVNYTTAAAPFPNLFISFRTRTDTYDNILGSSLNDRVCVSNGEMQRA
jgi:hypothetical protein